MKLYNFQAREAEVELEMAKSSVDCYLRSGYWTDTGEICTDAELDQLSTWNELRIAEEIQENLGGWSK